MATGKPPTCTEIHRQAMDKAEEAQRARRAGDDEYNVRVKFDQAFRLEWRAARMLDKTPEHEPSRSVLYRSAAWLAIDALRPELAEHLATCGLDGHPPAEIKRELDDVLARARADMENPDGT